jgi:hypothetical protein
MFFNKKFLYKFIDKFKTNLPVVNFAVSTISLYLQFNYLFSENKNKKDNLYIYDKT